MPSLGTIKWIGIGLAILAIVSYIGFLKLEVNHYKKERDDIQAAYTIIVHSQAIRTKALEDTVKEQSATIQKERTETNQKLKTLSDQHLKDIRENENLRNRIVSNELVGVLNRPVGISGPDQKGASNASEQGSNATPAGVGNSPVCTEQDVAIANEINKGNFELMRTVIIELQKVINDNERNLNGTP